jgi:pyruvate ferredoxin oxidoreductase delta subunit
MAKKKTEQKKWPEKWHEVTPGCMVFDAGNAANYKTGSWKAQRPILDTKKCIKCGRCVRKCPNKCLAVGLAPLFTPEKDEKVTRRVPVGGVPAGEVQAEAHK